MFTFVCVSAWLSVIRRLLIPAWCFNTGDITSMMVPMVLAYSCVPLPYSFFT